MKSISEQVREEKRTKKEPFNPIKSKFLQRYENFSDKDIFKELLFEEQLQSKRMLRIRTDINTIKWIVLISFVASIITGIILGTNIN